MSIFINEYIGTNAQKHGILVLIYLYIMRIEIILVPIYNNLTRSNKTTQNINLNPNPKRKAGKQP